MAESSLFALINLSKQTFLRSTRSGLMSETFTSEGIVWSCTHDII